MTTNTSIDWRLLRRQFLTAFAGAVLFDIVFLLVSYRVSSNILVITAAFLLFCIFAWRSSQSSHLMCVCMTTTGLSWGIMVAESVFLAIEDGAEAQYWVPTMIQGALVIPIITTAAVLPFWYFGRRRCDWHVKPMTYCFKSAMVTPVVLIGIYILTFSCYWFLSPSELVVSHERKLRQVEFQTIMSKYWCPGFWFVTHFCGYENSTEAGGWCYEIYVFIKPVQ